MSKNSIVRAVVEGWGGSVSEISTSNKQESDWLCELDGFKLLVEEKTKIESTDNKTAREDALMLNQTHSTVQKLAPNKRLSAIIRKAGSQLNSSSDIEHHARILWFTGMDFDGEAKYMQAVNTLYGMTKAFVPEGDGLRDCYFFYHSEFYRLRDRLDGAIIGHIVDGDTLHSSLCLNPYSQHWKLLKNSAFAVHMADGIIDPYEKELAGLALVADTSIDRNNTENVLEYLRNKYNKPKLLNMDMNLATTVISVPKHEC